MLSEKLKIKVFTLYYKVWFNHAFLLLSRKWKAPLTVLRPCFLNPSRKCFKESYYDWESTKKDSKAKSQNEESQQRAVKMKGKSRGP